MALADELTERTRAEKEIQALTGPPDHMHRKKSGPASLASCMMILVSRDRALSIAASNLKKNIAGDNAEARAQSERIQQKLIHMAESVRRLSHNLHPAMLEYSGLGSVLKSYFAEFSSLTGMEVTFHAKGYLDALPTSTALGLYRIAQEALQNVRKHAQVNRAEVDSRDSRTRCA